MLEYYFVFWCFSISALDGAINRERAIFLKFLINLQKSNSLQVKVKLV